MSGVGRRRWLQNLASVFVAGRFPATHRNAEPGLPEDTGKSLRLKDFEPRSMLHVPENKVPRARHPLRRVHVLRVPRPDQRVVHILLVRARREDLRQEQAAVQLQNLRRSRVRIGSMDLKIAATVLTKGATLLSRNKSDFERVPGLMLDDWSK